MAGLKRRTGERVIEQLRAGQSDLFYELNFELQVPVLIFGVVSDQPGAIKRNAHRMAQTRGFRVRFL
jgi:hypothetical protein